MSPLSWRGNSSINFAATGNGNLPMVNIKQPYPEITFDESKGGLLYQKKRRYMDETRERMKMIEVKRKNKEDAVTAEHKFKESSAIKKVSLGLQRHYATQQQSKTFVGLKSTRKSRVVVLSKKQVQKIRQFQVIADLKKDISKDISKSLLQEHMSKTRQTFSKVSQHSFRKPGATDSKHSDQSFRNTTIKESFEKIVINDNMDSTM